MEFRGCENSIEIKITRDFSLMTGENTMSLLYGMYSVGVAVSNSEKM